MRLDIKNMPEKVKLIHSIPYRKIFGTAQDVNLQNDSIKDFIANVSWKMVNTCIKDGGVGLAAPQISIPKKIIIIKEFTNPQLWDFTDVFNVYINPKSIPNRESGEWLFEESCLSVPGQNYEISRTNKTNVSYWKFNSDGKLEFVEEELEGYHARIFLHEYDHLHHISIVDRYNQQQKLKNKKASLEDEEEIIKQERESFFRRI